MSATTTVKTQPGHVYRIPISRGYAYGIVARSARGAFLGYFYLSQRPLSEAELAQLRPDRAATIQVGSARAIEDGRWPFVTRIPWTAEDWPVPTFRHQDATGGWWVLRSYDDRLRFTGEQSVNAEVAARFPEDGHVGCELLLQELDALALHSEAPAAA